MSHITVNDVHRLIDSRIRRHEVLMHGIVQQVEQPEPKIEPKFKNHNAQRWHECISDLHDLVALAVYRHYTTHPATAELLDTLKALRGLVNRYERDEAQDH